MLFEFGRILSSTLRMAYVGLRGVLINISYSEVLQSNFGYLYAFFSPLLHMEGDGTIRGDSTAFFQ
jgi:hypothetical protein